MALLGPILAAVASRHIKDTSATPPHTSNQSESKQLAHFVERSVTSSSSETARSLIEHALRVVHDVRSEEAKPGSDGSGIVKSDLMKNRLNLGNMNSDPLIRTNKV